VIESNVRRRIVRKRNRCTVWNIYSTYDGVAVSISNTANESMQDQT